MAHETLLIEAAKELAWASERVARIAADPKAGTVELWAKVKQAVHKSEELTDAYDLANARAEFEKAIAPKPARNRKRA